MFCQLQDKVENGRFFNSRVLKSTIWELGNSALRWDNEWKTPQVKYKAFFRKGENLEAKPMEKSYGEGNV